MCSTKKRKDDHRNRGILECVLIMFNWRYLITENMNCAHFHQKIILNLRVLKDFFPPPKHVSDSGKFKGVPEIKKEVETEEKYLPSKVKKFGLIQTHQR